MDEQKERTFNHKTASALTGDDYTDYTEVDHGTHGGDVHEHHYVLTQSDARSNLVSAQCRECWHGVNINPDLIEVRDGQLVSIQ